MTKVQEYILRRDGMKDLRIKGEIIANVSSREDEPRWTEIRIYRTLIASDIKTRKVFVLEVVGRSSHANEKDLCAVHTCSDAMAVARELLFGRTYYTDLSKEAMYAAAEHEPSFNAAITEEMY